MAGCGVFGAAAPPLPATSDKFLLFAVGIACFGVALQVGFAMINLLKNWLGTLLARKDTASSQS
jgi:hypothetical protein